MALDHEWEKINEHYEYFIIHWRLETAWPTVHPALTGQHFSKACISTGDPQHGWSPAPLLLLSPRSVLLWAAGVHCLHLPKGPLRGTVSWLSYSALTLLGLLSKVNQNQGGERPNSLLTNCGLHNMTSHCEATLYLEIKMPGAPRLKEMRSSKCLSGSFWWIQRMARKSKTKQDLVLR